MSENEGATELDHQDADFQLAVHGLIRADQDVRLAESSRRHWANLGFQHTFLSDAQCETLEGLRGQEIIAQAPLSVGELIARLEADAEQASRATD
jgi:hypothetical protein